jgi:negative regulator of flagellin synthesis FlgM
LKISELEISRLLAYSPADRSSSTASTGSATADGGAARGGQASSVDTSSTAQDVQRITQLIKSLPDVREDRVQALKAQVENGTYHVSSEDIADLIIRRALADNTAL